MVILFTDNAQHLYNIQLSSSQQICKVGGHILFIFIERKMILWLRNMLEAATRTASFNILEFLPHHRRLRSQGCVVSQIVSGNMVGIFQGIEKLTFFEYGSTNWYIFLFQFLLQYTLVGRKVLPYSVAKALKPSSSDWWGIHFFL